MARAAYPMQLRAAERRISQRRVTLCSPLDGILGGSATPAGDRPLARPPLLGAFSP